MRRSTSAIVAIAAVAIVAVAALAFLGGPRGPSSQAGARPIPDGATVLFESNRDTGGGRKEVYAMDYDGLNVTRITTTQIHHFLTGIDPSGRFLIVSGADQDTHAPLGLGDEDRRALWVIDTITGNATRITARENSAEGDSVSPDGQWIVFHMALSGSLQSDLYKIRLDGTGLTRLTSTDDASECDPCWSPDGSEISFTCYSAGVPRFVLTVMGEGGGYRRTVYDPVDAVSTTAFPPGAYDPSWSPDGQWICFEEPVSFGGENGGAGVWHIFKIHPDGSGLTDLSLAGGHDGWSEYLPSFSADGSSVVFSVRAGPADASKTEVDVYVMDSDGGSLKRLTSGASVDDFAIWVTG